MSVPAAFQTHWEGLKARFDATAPALIARFFAEHQGIGVSAIERVVLDGKAARGCLTCLLCEALGGDLDAAWEDSAVAGEESVGGTTPTPDQDIVDEIGEAAGLTYSDDEPLDSDKKVLDRDRHRWELDPASTDDDEKDKDHE